MSVNPSWYDLLDVDSSASADEIRTAWKAAIAELDPTDRKFRVLNQAAEVLLDPESRAEYDATLVTEPEPEPEPEPDPEPEPVVVEAPAEPEPAVEKASTAARTGRSVPAWVLAVLGLVAVALITACIVKAQDPTDTQVDDATAAALAASAPAVQALLSYDYRDLEGTRKAVEAVTTDTYFTKQYDPFFEGVVKDNAPNTKTIVQAEVVEAGIVRSGDDRVQVFVLVNRPTTNAETTEPTIYRDSATVTMEKVGDEWLIDALDTDALK